MSTERPSLHGVYTDSTNTAVLVVLISLLFAVVFFNLFAIVSILRHCCPSTCTVLICSLSTVEVFQIVTCGTTTIYSYYNKQHSFDNSSTLCTFYGWVYVVFRLKATLIVSLLVFDRAILSLQPKFYIRVWCSTRTRWILGSVVFLLAVIIASIPVTTSSYRTSPDGRRFYCFYKYNGAFAVFYIVFHLLQTVWTCVAMPWIISREERVDATLSVLLVGEMVECRKGRNIVEVRDWLKISRLVSAVVLLYHACSVPLPVLLLLRFLEITYDGVVGLLALQLPTFCALLLPVLYGLMWKPFRRAYYSSVSCICPTTRDIRTRSIRSIANPAFCETREEYDNNSILHTRGVSLAPEPNGSSQASTQSQRLQLDPNLLNSGTTVDDSFRPPSEHRPRTTSFQDRHFIMPSKFQNIFEIIDALSAPHRDSVDADSAGSSKWTTPRGSHDSLSSLNSSSSPVKLKDVSLSMPESPNIFRDIDFSAVHLSGTQFSEKKVDKLKLETELSSSSNRVKAAIYSENQEEGSSSAKGPIRFTNLRKVRTEKRPESFSCDNPFGNEERFRKYLPDERT